MYRGYLQRRNLRIFLFEQIKTEIFFRFVYLYKQIVKTNLLPHAEHSEST